MITDQEIPEKQVRYYVSSCYHREIDFAMDFLELKVRPSVMMIDPIYGAAWYDARDRTIYLTHFSTLEHLFHECVHFAQHWRGEDMFINYKALYGAEEYRRKYAAAELSLEKEATEKAVLMLKEWKERGS